MASVIDEKWIVKAFEEGEFIGYVDKYMNLTMNEDDACVNTLDEAKQRRDEAIEVYPDYMVVAEVVFIDQQY